VQAQLEQHTLFQRENTEKSKREREEKPTGKAINRRCEGGGGLVSMATQQPVDDCPTPTQTGVSFREQSERKSRLLLRFALDSKQ
jgi:hypothetical protein